MEYVCLQLLTSKDSVTESSSVKDTIVRIPPTWPGAAIQVSKQIYVINFTDKKHFLCSHLQGHH